MIQLVLTGLRQMRIRETVDPVEIPFDGFSGAVHDVICCAVCRTDAKMWDQGHRDLCLPRVPGHEMVVRDDEGNRYAVWPGTSCGHCRYCLGRRENLCEEMKIMGFHTDGGFAGRVFVPDACRVPLPDNLPDPVACFAEPVGCVINALEKLGPVKGRRVIVHGGGTMGLTAALVLQDAGALPLVIEKSEAKIDRVSLFLSDTGIECVKDTHQSEFDAALNACADHAAFCQAVAKVRKGGRICFFSGLTKNRHLETNLVNLLHYRELVLAGAYGLTRRNMVDGVPFMVRQKTALSHLIEACITPEQMPEVLSDVLSGKMLKYIVDVSGGQDVGRFNPADPVPDKGQLSGVVAGDSIQQSKGFMADRGAESGGKDECLCREVIDGIDSLDLSLKSAAQAKIDNKTKPLGALGTLEDLALQMALIQRNLSPRIRRKALFVFAADHGVTEEGVSAYPREVTRQMVDNFLSGGAAINVLCRHHGIDLKIVDMGVEGRFAPHPDLIDKKVCPATRNFALEPAMTRAEMFQALAAGMAVFLESHDAAPIDIVGLGEMGIGNTTAASAIISTICGIEPSRATGRGTGVDDQGLSHKTEVIERVLAFHLPDPKDGMDILQKIGGFEIAGIAGAALAAASKGCAVVLDGVISTAAGLLAGLICPDIRGYLISGHRSVEVAQKAALDHLGLESVIDFSMRLGEGTGAALTMDTAEAACRIMCEMASFEDAGVSRSAVDR